MLAYDAAIVRGGSNSSTHAEGGVHAGVKRLEYAMERPRTHAARGERAKGLRRARQCDRGEKPNRWKAAGRSVRMGKQSPPERVSEGRRRQTR